MSYVLKDKVRFKVKFSQVLTLKDFTERHYIWRYRITCDIDTSLHLRFHKALDNLEHIFRYDFKNRYLLHLVLVLSYHKNIYIILAQIGLCSWWFTTWSSPSTTIVSKNLLYEHVFKCGINISIRYNF